MSNPAPGDLERVRGFVNTYDAEDLSDDIETPEQLATWLGVPAATPAEHRRALAVRDALRTALLAHHGDEVDVPAGVLADASRRAVVTLELDPAGRPTLRPSATGVDGALGELLAIVHAAEAEGHWARLKICPADDCRWAFYDRSRNRSATWCDMKVCGNRHKVAQYRERRLKAS
jgi:predicted RNA-binding Zn ribbon-like protein